ncbi:MAG: CvpA family protein [Moorellaceae bacterium]
MINYLDLLLLGGLIWGAWRGYRRGLINLAAGVLGYLVGLLVALNGAGPLARLFDEQWKVTARAGAWVAAHLPLPRLVLDQELSIPAIKQMDSLVAGWPLPGSLKAGLLTYLVDARGKDLTLGEALGGVLVFWLLKIVAALFLFYFSLWLLRRCGNWASRGWGFTPWGLNRLLGLALGVGSQALYLSLFLGLVDLGLKKGLIVQFPFLEWAARQLTGSQLAPPLLDLFFWLEGLLDRLF